MKGEWKPAEGFSLTYLPFISRATIDALAEFPHLNASVGENELVVHNYVDLGIAVDLDYEGLIVPVIRDADGKRLRAIAREINDLAGRAAPGSSTRRDQRRHVHHLQQRLGRLGADDADHQPAAGGDPLDRAPSCASRSWCRRRRRRGDRHPSRRQPGDGVGPPRVRRRLRRRLPQADQGDPRDPGLVGRAEPGCRQADPRSLRSRWLGTVPYREALAVQQALFDHGREDHLLLLEHPHVFTYGRTRTSTATCAATRRRSAPTSSASAAAATSPTTGPASSSATRSSTWRPGSARPSTCATSSSS